MFIFKRTPDGSLSEYYTVSNGAHEWSKDKDIACQFGRQTDAVNMLKMLYPAPRIPIEIVDLSTLGKTQAPTVPVEPASKPVTTTVSSGFKGQQGKKK